MASSPEPSASGGAATLARGQARAILDERRFRAAPIPRPLHGLLHALGSALESPLEGLRELVGTLAVVTPGGTTTVWAILAAVALALGGLLAVRGARRALGEPAVERAGARGARRARAQDLERDATTAEAQGRFADAVRLRFRAGLMRLHERELLDAAPSMLNAEISRALRSERFDALARRFEEIAYGASAAAPEDAQVSLREWSRLLDPGGER